MGATGIGATGIGRAGMGAAGMGAAGIGGAGMGATGTGREWRGWVEAWVGVEGGGHGLGVGGQSVAQCR